MKVLENWSSGQDYIDIFLNTDISGSRKSVLNLTILGM